MEWRRMRKKLLTTPTDLGAAEDRIAIAALLATLLVSLTGSVGVKAMVGGSSMWNPLVQATMANVAAEAGGQSGVRVLVLGGQGRAALVCDPCGHAHKKYITISHYPMTGEEKRLPLRATTAANDNKNHNHEDRRTTAAGGGMRSDDDGRQTIIGDRAFVMLEDADQYL